MNMNSNPQAVWETCVTLAAIKAKQAHPQANGRIDKAVALVLAGAVDMQEDGHSAKVASQTDPLVTYYVEGRHCPCADATRTGQLCKHSYATFLTRKAMALAKELPATEAPEPAEDHGIPRGFLVEIRGGTFVKYDGLMHLGRARGVLQVQVHFTHVTDTWVLAEATVVMGDGTKWTEAADSTPDNVGAGVKAHWRRLALTRAKARALRMALGVNLVAVEELD